MPLDATGPYAKAVQVLTRMESRFRTGKWCWIQNNWHREGDRHCLAGAIELAIPPFDPAASQVLGFLAAAIRAEGSNRPLNELRTVIDFNDVNGCTLEDILTIIARAKELGRDPSGSDCHARLPSPHQPRRRRYRGNRALAGSLNTANPRPAVRAAAVPRHRQIDAVLPTGSPGAREGGGRELLPIARGSRVPAPARAPEQPSPKHRQQET